MADRAEPLASSAVASAASASASMSARLQPFADAIFGRAPLGTAVGLDLDRVRLYARFVRGHVMGVLEKLYPVTRAATGAGWEALIDRYRSAHPPTHYELNRAGERFPEFLAAENDLPAHLSEAADFEWTQFAVATARDPESVRGLPAVTPVRGAALNPTLAARTYRHRIARWVSDANRSDVPTDEPETVLLYRHPETLDVRWTVPPPETLAVLRMVHEARSPESIAREVGASQTDLESALAILIDRGLVISG